MSKHQTHGGRNRLNTLDSQDGADPNYDQIIREICQVVKTGVVVRAACFRWDFLSVMRPNSFSVGAYVPDFFPLERFSNCSMKWSASAICPCFVKSSTRRKYAGTIRGKCRTSLACSSVSRYFSIAGLGFVQSPKTASST